MNRWVRQCCRPGGGIKWYANQGGGYIRKNTVKDMPGGGGKQNLSTRAASVLCCCCRPSRPSLAFRSPCRLHAIQTLSLSRLSHDRPTDLFTYCVSRRCLVCVSFVTVPWTRQQFNTLCVCVCECVCVSVWVWICALWTRLTFSTCQISIIGDGLNVALSPDWIGRFDFETIIKLFFCRSNQLGLSVWNSCEIVNWMSHVQRTWFQEENFDNQLRVSVADSTNRHFLICNLRRSSWRLHCWSSTGSFGSCSSSALSQVSRISSIQRLAHLMASFRMSQTRLTLLCI
jgi:hypothetical protein